MEWGVENLFVEILVRRHINISDPYLVFIITGDPGARTLLYCASLEHQWMQKQQFPVNSERK